MAKILLDRLERISADSGWAHQASGIRASLARAVAAGGEPDLLQLSQLLEQGFQILENAAGEIPDEAQTQARENKPGLDNASSS